MNFTVNGIPYHLTFDDGQAQWFLLTPADHGVALMEIHDDETPLEPGEGYALSRGPMAPPS